MTVRDQLIARIPHLPTAEFILRIKDRYRVITLISEAICTITDIQLRGCYNCARGARATVKCVSSTKQEMAEILCGRYAFTVPCTSSGTVSKLRFAASTARMQILCSIQCGQKKSNFEITGILRYTGSLDAAVKPLLEGKSEIFSEINLPDLGHIMEVYLQSAGTVLAVAAAVMIALFSTYLCVTTGMLCTLFKCMNGVLWKVMLLYWRTVSFVLRMPHHLFSMHAERHDPKPQEKLL
ncbi:hypothetical protein RB195_010473 [Necator americanus]